MKDLLFPTRPLLFVLLAGCTGYELHEDEPCRDVGYGVSARVFACTEDHDDANAAYELFDDTYGCNNDSLDEIERTQGISAMFDCSRRANELTCEQIDAADEIDAADLDAWLLGHPECQAILVR